MRRSHQLPQHFRGETENVVENVFVNGRRATATFDTGNGGPILVTGLGIARLGLADAAKRGRSKMAYGYNGGARESVGRLNEVRVGAIDFAAGSATFAPSADSPYDINIGNQSMQPYRVVFDYVRKLVTFLRPAACTK